MYLRCRIPARIRHALHELPETLDEACAHALKEIDRQNREYAHRLFQCVAAASRPFSVEELAEFLAFDFDAGATPRFLADWRPEDPTHAVLSTCVGFLSVVVDPTLPVIPPSVISGRSAPPTTSDSPVLPSSPSSPPRDGDTMPFIPPDLGPAWGSIATPRQVPPEPSHSATPTATRTATPTATAFITPSTTPNIGPPRRFARFSTVQFAYFSDKEYFESARLAEEKDTISRFHVSMTPAHTIIAQACLGVLLHLDENITNETLKEFPLAEYAAEHWMSHARYENVAPNVLDGLKRLFDPSKNHLSVWVWIYDRESPWYFGVRPESPTVARATALHYAASCGMHEIATFLIVEHSQDVNARGFVRKETPLHVAVRRGHIEVARVLLEHGADTEARDNHGRTPLLRASRDGHIELARVLLKHGANTEARDKENSSPLDNATEGGHVEFAQILLDHGADVNARDKEGTTSLHWASAMRQTEVALVLIRRGADLEARTKRNETLLHVAEGEEVTRLLLEQGADANALGDENGTPLHAASKMGRVGPARILLEHGANPNARDANDATPLHLATDPRTDWTEDGEHLAVVLLLIQYGSDIHARDDKGRTPFMRAEEGSKLPPPDNFFPFL